MVWLENAVALIGIVDKKEAKTGPKEEKMTHDDKEERGGSGATTEQQNNQQRYCTTSSTTADGYLNPLPSDLLLRANPVLVVH